MVVHADALSDRLGAVHLAARGPAVAMDEPEVRDASWTRARDRARGASRGADGQADDADEASMTASESDWSDAELRDQIVASAEARGASYFGWRDLTALKSGGSGGGSGQVAFASHVPSGSPSKFISSAATRDRGMLLVAALAGGVLALGARRLL